MTKRFPPEPRWAQYYSEEEYMTLLEDRANWPELQRVIGCSESTLRYWARKYGFSYKRGRKAEFLDNIPNSDIQTMYNAAWSLSKMAETIGCDVTALKHRLNRMGLANHSPVWRRFYSEEEMRRLLSLYPVGWDQIMHRCNVVKRTVYRWAKRLGVPNPTG